MTMIEFRLSDEKNPFRQNITNRKTPREKEIISRNFLQCSATEESDEQHEQAPEKYCCCFFYFFLWRFSQILAS